MVLGAKRVMIQGGLLQGLGWEVAGMIGHGEVVIGK
jgi:hypothetical protein